MSRLLERARDLMAKPGAWLSAEGGAYALRLSPPVFHRLKELAGSRMTAGGEIVFTARRFRTQESNRSDARDRLAEMLREAHRLPEKRVESRLNRVGKAARLDGKKKRGAVKAGRGRVQMD